MILHKALGAFSLSTSFPKFTYIEDTVTVLRSLWKKKISEVYSQKLGEENTKRKKQAEEVYTIQSLDL